MKQIGIIVGVVVIAVALFLLARYRALSGREKAKGEETYTGLRNMVLHGTRSKFSLPETSGPTEPWGVVMDWGVQRGTATVVALSDGTASVYMSSGGGFIGGIGQEPIRTAAKKAVEVARGIQPSTHTTSAYPVPPRGGVIFYLLTDAGVFTTSTTERDLQSATYSLRQLGDAMQDVITQYRLWSEQQEGSK